MANTLTHRRRILTLAVATATAACFLGISSAVADDDAEQAAAFLGTWCLDCHDSSRAKGKVNFEALVMRLSTTERTPEDADLLRRARIRIADGIMPPADHDAHPTAAEREAAVPTLVRASHVAPGRIHPPGTVPRRLNRVEYANTVRDLFGVDVAQFGAMPPDDVGAGFDNVATVLSLSPTTFERMMDIAEGVALKACPDRATAQTEVRQFSGKQLNVQKNSGSVNGDACVLFANGRAERTIEVPREGVYALSFKGYGIQAGPEPAKCALVVDGKPVAYFDIPEKASAPGSRRFETTLRAGDRKLGVEFLNDFYNAGPPKQDRNLVVQEFMLEGPLDAPPEPAWRAQMEADCAGGAMDAAAASGATATPGAPNTAARAHQAWLVHRVLRRPCTEADLATLATLAPVSAIATAEAGTGASAPAGDLASDPASLRAVITALLVHPEFLFRIEGESGASAAARGEAAGREEAAVRDLTPHELATRLSYYLWASTPDPELQRAADSGALAMPAERARQVDRMLRDPRSSSLADRFATQWLGIDGVEQHMPDPTQFAGVDPALMQSMRSETVMLFDAVLRENRPASELLDADYTFVDARLAAHYGVPAPTAAGMRRVPAPPDRGGGVLAHASVLLATSNPTRTSPVKRGKWVLESLLDSAPPPPPPGAPALPERVEDRHGMTLRQSLERHRADPACAACHVRMDALGFAFEHYDAVGRRRDRADGAPIDSRGTLPSGRDVSSLDDLRAVLLADPDFTRSLAKHLMVYATGRAASPADEAAVDNLVRSLGAAPTLRSMVVAVTESPSFLRRGLPPTAPQAVGAPE